MGWTGHTNNCFVASRLIVPSVRHSTVGDRAFLVAGPRVWNTLPETSTSQSLLTFRQQLKTWLFGKSYLDIIMWTRICLNFTINLEVVLLLSDGLIHWLLQYTVCQILQKPVNICSLVIEPRLNGLKYRNIVCITRHNDARGLLWYRVLRYGTLVVGSFGTNHELNLGKGTIVSHYWVQTRAPQGRSATKIHSGCV